MEHEEAVQTYLAWMKWYYGEELVKDPSELNAMTSPHHTMISLFPLRKIPQGCLSMRLCVFALLIVSVLAKEYLNPGRVRELHSDHDEIEVACYSNGLFWTCPNPFDDYRAPAIEQNYQQGMWVDKHTYRLSQDEFDAPDSWNS